MDSQSFAVIPVEGDSFLRLYIGQCTCHNGAEALSRVICDEHGGKVFPRFFTPSDSCGFFPTDAALYSVTNPEFSDGMPVLIEEISFNGMVRIKEVYRLPSMDDLAVLPGFEQFTLKGLCYFCRSHQSPNPPLP